MLIRSAEGTWNYSVKLFPMFPYSPLPTEFLRLLLFSTCKNSTPPYIYHAPQWESNPQPPCLQSDEKEAKLKSIVYYLLQAILDNIGIYRF